MGITLTFSCGGCDAFVQGKKAMTRTFHSFSGRSHGFGTYRIEPIEDLVPDGWIAFDPYTSCTYCPKCWKEIERAAEPDDVRALRREKLRTGNWEESTTDD